MIKDILRDEYIKKSNIPSRYINNIKIKVLDENNNSIVKLKKILDNTKKFVKNGYNLFLYSNITGNGKTSWACAIAKKYVQDYACNYDIECPILFINVAEFLNDKKAAIKNEQLLDKIKEVEYNINKADLVIWDDLAIKGLSEYDSEQLYTFINYRIANMKSNIFTANHKPENLEEIIGARLYSRVVNSSINIELVGADKRNLDVEFNL